MYRFVAANVVEAGQAIESANHFLFTDEQHRKGQKGIIEWIYSLEHTHNTASYPTRCVWVVSKSQMNGAIWPATSLRPLRRPEKIGLISRSRIAVEPINSTPIGPRKETSSKPQQVDFRDVGKVKKKDWMSLRRLLQQQIKVGGKTLSVCISPGAGNGKLRPRSTTSPITKCKSGQEFGLASLARRCCVVRS